MLKYCFKEIFRIKGFKIFPILVIALNSLFFAVSRGRIMPFSFVFQLISIVYIFTSLYFSSRIEEDSLKETFDFYKNKRIEYFLSYIFSMSIISFFTFLISSLFIFIISKVIHIKLWCYLDTINTLFLYSFLYSVAYMLIGFFVGKIVKGKMKYFVALVLTFIISPMSTILLPYVSFVYKLTFGPPNIRASYLTYYGFDVETVRYYKCISICLILFSLILIFKEKIESKTNKIMVSFSLIFSILFAFLYFKPHWVYKSLHQDESSYLTYDSNYYNDKNNLKNKENPNYKIVSMDVKLYLHDSSTFNVKMKIESIKDIDKIIGNLYHKFKIENVFVNGVKTTFNQKSDFFSINKNLKKGESCTIELDYSGVSSPMYPINRKGVFLPSNFNYLPLNEYSTLAKTDSYSGVYFLDKYIKDQVQYKLTISGMRKEIITNLPINMKNNNGELEYIGKSNKGISIYAGNFNKITNNLYEIGYLDDYEITDEALNKFKKLIKEVSIEYGLISDYDNLKVVYGDIGVNKESISDGYNTDPNNIIFINSFEIDENRVLALLLQRESFLSKQSYLSSSFLFDLINNIKSDSQNFYDFSGVKSDENDIRTDLIKEFVKLPLEKRKEIIKSIIKRMKNGEVIVIENLNFK